jgi:Ser/Thr protein kinase RdoA (MazF antagonist)
MDPKIATRFNDTILHTAMQRYDIAVEEIHLLDGFESFIYEFSRSDGDFILRIGHSLRRTPAMIHGEVDWINYLFVDDDYVMTLFDFDDCVYGHLVYDIAMVLFYIAGWGGDDVPGFTGRFMPVFFQGYREHNHLDPAWLKEIPHFLKLREIDLFATILFTMGETPEDAWCARYMKGRREKIERDVPFIKFDWETLANDL